MKHLLKFKLIFLSLVIAILLNNEAEALSCEQPEQLELKPLVRAEMTITDMLLLSHMYQQGKYVAQDLAKSDYWALQADILKSKTSEQVQNVDANETNPYQFNRRFEEQLRLAKQGDAAAMGQVAKMYLVGISAEQSLAEAVHWFEMAAAAGDKYAATLVAERKFSEIKPLLKQQQSLNPNIYPQRQQLQQITNEMKYIIQRLVELTAAYEKHQAKDLNCDRVYKNAVKLYQYRAKIEQLKQFALNNQPD
ncbi:sel1 repeat family protein [Paraferrimonas sp. SM1919]|uniref:sel1 repeat family protein n=1 Tax=Paraferrimonas sp. SM1919 TaxID=2662263 RepID=UPI0013D53B19|nr:sel1 repeat family protein [Paraferrimonas sp. SM1919]